MLPLILMGNGMGIKPKDMFAFIMSRIESLGAPRIRKSKKKGNILNFMAVPP